MTCDMDFSEMPFDTQVVGAFSSSSSGLRSTPFMLAPTSDPPCAQVCAIRLGACSACSAWVGNDLNTPLVFFGHDTSNRIRDSSIPYGGTPEWSVVGYSANYTHGRQADGLPPLTAENAPRHQGGARVEPILAFRIHLQRSSRYWVESIMLPAVLLVVMSYGTIYIQRTAMPARAAFSAICFLTLATRINAVLATIPFSEKSNSAATAGVHTQLADSQPATTRTSHAARVTVLAVLLDFLKVSDIFCAFVLAVVVVTNYLLHIELRVNKARDEYHKKYPQGGGTASTAGSVLSGRVALGRRSGKATSTTTPGAVHVDVKQQASASVSVDVEVESGQEAEAAPSIRQFVARHSRRSLWRELG